jgi:hypothetical protein
MMPESFQDSDTYPHKDTVHRLNTWTLDRMTWLNREILAGRLPVAALITELTTQVLPALPSPAFLSRKTAQQLIVLMGFWGACVARHQQEHDRSLTSAPERALAPLRIGSESFQEYLTRVVIQSGTGHPPRDSTVSLVRWNPPTATVRWNQRTLTYPGVFDDGRTRSYTGNFGEIEFFCLHKRSEALERAINQILEPLHTGRVPITSELAVRAILDARDLLGIVRKLFIDFTALPPERKLSPQHFSGVMRQFAVHWQKNDVPPSGAEDPEYVKRDYILGINYPCYEEHIQTMLPAMLSTDRKEIATARRHPSLPQTLIQEAKINTTDLHAASDRQLLSLVATCPALEATHQLLAAQARLSSAHLMLATRYVYEMGRRDADTHNERIVSNDRGTTGMNREALRRLHQGRRTHTLARLSRLRQRDLVDASGIAPPRAVTSEDVATAVTLP